MVYIFEIIRKHFLRDVAPDRQRNCANECFWQVLTYEPFFDCRIQICFALQSVCLDPLDKPLCYSGDRSALKIEAGCRVAKSSLQQKVMAEVHLYPYIRLSCV